MDHLLAIKNKLMYQTIAPAIVRMADMPYAIIKVSRFLLRRIMNLEEDLLSGRNTPSFAKDTVYRFIKSIQNEMRIDAQGRACYT